MRRSTPLFLAAMLFLGGSAVSVERAAAQNEPSADALATAEELVSFISPDMVQQLTTGLEKQIWPPMERSIRNQIPTVDQQTLSDIRAAISEQTNKFLDEQVPELKKDIVRAYALRFSADELTDVIDFYRTPTGAKLLRLLPEITAETSAAYVAKLPALNGAVKNSALGILRERGYIK